MSIIQCMKCVSYLFKTIKVMHIIKKILAVILCFFVAIIGIGLLSENNKAVKEWSKAIKKKVM